METSPELCDICRHIKLEDYFSQAEYPGTVELGPFQDIDKKKDRCLLCRLVVQALNGHSRDHWKPGVYPVEVCYLGRYSGRTNQVVLDVWFNSTSETLRDSSWGYDTTQCQILSVQPCRPVCTEDDDAGAISRGRILGEKVDLTLIRGWLERCTSSHGPKCNNNPRPYTREVPGPRLLLIDVQSMKIAECEWTSRYLALSYVWGATSNKSLTSTKANIQHLKQDAALREVRDELPRAINDAIDLTKAVGETYLWVDALCIVQDDDRSKAIYIPRMDQIYGNAFATFVTLCNDKAPGGSELPGVTHPRILVQSPVEIAGLHLVPRLPPLISVDQRSVWSSRAWTFQEGIFSRRYLFFAEHQVFWQCRTACHSEDCADEHMEDRGAGSVVFPDRRFNALEMMGTVSDPRRQFNVYELLVGPYSPRSLTIPADSLAAFSGVISALQDSFGWKFASALPESLFDLALLWRPRTMAALRPRHPSGQKDTQNLPCKSPTWCWTAWNGNIHWAPWRFSIYAGQRVTIKTEVTGFWIVDSGSLSQIKRGLASDSNADMPKYAEVEKPVPVAPALVFEAKTVNAKAYDISEPQLDQCGLWDSEKAGSGLSRYFRNIASNSLWIYDGSGKHCGKLSGLSPDSWRAQCGDHHTRHELVLLSRSIQDEVTQAAIQAFRGGFPPEYASAWEYYEDVFDTRCYSYKRDWALNIMLVRWEDGVAERVAVGQMHADAWNEARQESKVITLA
ncbi:HET-domain-containing protein [Apiospora hydei]|uniref:HET-domain-containing protein n=1 Tax=Apiospora hydei TaxID=1337664 RepID=A0ABR1WPL7_9PEZI